MAKFKKGDRVRIKEGVDLARIGIFSATSQAELENKDLTLGKEESQDWWDIDGWLIPVRHIKKA